MSSVVEDAIAAELLLVTRVTEIPTGPLGFGYDLYGDTDLRSEMPEVDGVAQPMLLLGLAMRRRLDTPRGALPEDPDYGLDLKSFLNRGTPAQSIRELAGRIRAEVQKDDRVERASVTVTPNSTGSTLTVAVRITPRSTVGPFELVLAVTSAQVLIDAISEAA